MNFTTAKHCLCLIVLFFLCLNSIYAQTPGAASFHNYGGTVQLAFNNARISTTQPVFRLSTATGTNPNIFGVEINTSSTFTGTAWVQTFPGAYTSGTAYNVTFTNSFTPVDGTTYYVRARASADNGTTWSAYTTGAYSFTYEASGNPYWYQDVQAQWLTDSLAGTTATVSNNIQLTSIGGGGGNPFTNPSFENGTTGWTLTSNAHHYNNDVNSWLSSCNETGSYCYGVTNGTNCLSMWNDEGYWGYCLSPGDYLMASQMVNLTGVPSISFSQSFYDFVVNSLQCSSNSSAELRVIIDPGNTSNNLNGTNVYTWTVASNCGNIISPTTATINLSGYTFTGNNTVKFVSYIYGTDCSQGDAPQFFIDNIVAALPSTPGYVASTPIYLASVQGATNWGILKWNQTLSGGTIKLEVKKLVAGAWTDAPGLNNISSTTDGDNVFDISSLGTTGVDSIKIFATITASGATSPSLNNWAVEELALPAITATANAVAVADTVCSGSTIVLSANPVLPAFNNCTGSWQYAWFNGSHYWNGSAFVSDTPVYSFDSITVTNVIAGNTFTATVNCSASKAAVNNSSVAVSIYPNPAINISLLKNNVCAGTLITFTATATNTGANPSYNFYVNGNSVQNSASNIYSTGSLNNNDSVWAVITTNRCVPALSATSSKIHLAILPKSFINLTETVCYGQTYGGHNATGNYVDTLTATNGCDSIRTLNLTVLPPIDSAISQTICNGQTFNGHSATGVYTDTLRSSGNCDSILTVNLKVLSSIKDTVIQNIYQGQSYDGYSTAGVFTDSFVATGGCDSTRVLILTVLSPISDTIMQTICYGQSFAGHDSNGIFTDTLHASGGCDSIFRVLHLTVITPVTSIDKQVICQGENFDGHTTSGHYNDTILSTLGCDSSIISLELNVLPASAMPVISQNGDSLISTPANSYAWYEDTTLLTDTSQVLILSHSGNFKVVVKDSLGGCSTTSAIFMAVFTGINDIVETPLMTVYPDPANEVLNIQISKLSSAGDFYINLYDGIGNLVLSRKSNLTGGDNIQLRIADLAEELYFLKVQQDSWAANKKVLIVR